MGSDRMFFRNLTLVLALLALAGFGPSYYFRSLADTPAQLTTLMHWHGLAFSLWMLLLVLQAFLVNNGKLQWHRTLGYSSVALAAAMMMLAAALAFARTLMWLSDPAIDSCEVLAFLAIPATTILTFTGLYSAAIALRERPAIHKRLMLIASFDIVTPAMARLPFMVELSAVWHYVAIDLLLVAIAAHDWRVFKRVHPATLVGGAVLLLSQVGREWLSRSDSWLAFAEWLTG